MQTINLEGKLITQDLGSCASKFSILSPCQEEEQKSLFLTKEAPKLEFELTKDFVKATPLK